MKFPKVIFYYLKVKLLLNLVLKIIILIKFHNNVFKFVKQMNFINQHKKHAKNVIKIVNLVMDLYLETVYHVVIINFYLLIFV